MTAEPIAAVVADIRAGRVQHPAAFDTHGRRYSTDLLTRAQLPQPVVDSTAIHAAESRKGMLNPYEDHPSIVPPWDDAFLCWVNSFGNVLAAQVHRVNWDGSARSYDEWMTDNEVDWPRVRWIAETTMWVGGSGDGGRPFPTSGPCHMFRHAIHDDGSPADINWIALSSPRGQIGKHSEIEGDPNLGAWESAMVVIGAALNFLNAVNTDIAEPSRPRAERRRLERTGVQVQTIVVRPPGKRRAKTGEARPIGVDETALSPVRGHFSHYGEQYGRGLLFGRHSGKYWIAPHVRGAGEDAEPRDYVLRPRRPQADSEARVR